MMPTMVVVHSSNRTRTDMVNRTYHVEAHEEDHEEEEDVSRILVESIEDVVVLLEEVAVEVTEDDAIWDNNSLKEEVVQVVVELDNILSRMHHEEADEMDEYPLAVVEEEGHSKPEVHIMRDDHKLEFNRMANMSTAMSLQLLPAIDSRRTATVKATSITTTTATTATLTRQTPIDRWSRQRNSTTAAVTTQDTRKTAHTMVMRMPIDNRPWMDKIEVLILTECRRPRCKMITLTEASTKTDETNQEQAKTDRTWMAVGI